MDDTMENWEQRKAQVRRIVGTSDPERLRRVIEPARDHLRRQRAARRGDRGPAWTSAGPRNVPGRIGALAMDPADGRILYAGSAAGGVFKSTDGGASWAPLWSQEQASLAIGGLGIGPGVIYAATGEWEGGAGTTNYHHFPGVGVYVSRDGGASWALAPIPSAWTAAVAVDPTDPDRVLVAGNAGLHRSRDGGRTWDTYGNLPAEPISDVVIDPADPRRVYAGVHGRGVWRTRDGGGSWEQLPADADPANRFESPKVALGRSGVPGHRFVAVLTRGRVLTSRDSGNTFTGRGQLRGLVDGQPVLDDPSYAAWCTAIAVDPRDDDVLLAGHVRLWRSDNGGRDWTFVSATGHPAEGRGHSDIQAIVFDPGGADHVYVATDGGVFESTDNGRQWWGRSQGLLTAQCYTVAIARTPPFRRAITTQDNRCHQSEGAEDFPVVLDRLEGGWVEYDPGDSRTVYVDTRFPGGSSPVRKLRLGPDGSPTGSTLLRDDTGAFIESDAAIREALAIARTRPASMLLVASAGHVLHSDDAGARWRRVPDFAGHVMCAVEYSPTDETHAYAASDTAALWHSSAGGMEGSWVPIARGALPNQSVNDIAVDPANPLRLYVALGNDDVTFGEDTAALWRGDLSAAPADVWSPASGAIPAAALPPRLPLTGIALDPATPGTIYVSHLLGVHRSLDAGSSWEPFDDALPNCFVSDLDLHEPTRTLYAATMGRGLYRRPV